MQVELSGFQKILTKKNKKHPLTSHKPSEIQTNFKLKT